MTEFQRQIEEVLGQTLHAIDLRVIQVNLGLKCNQSCAHCHLEASPHHTEMMDWPVMEAVLRLAREARPEQIDLTGGAVELNPHLKRFIEALRRDGHHVQVRTNLTILAEEGMTELPGFFRDHEVALVASLPCYLEENVDAQRGKGVHQKSVAVLKHLNELGYGREKNLPLNLVYNPGGPALPAPQVELEEDYRRELKERFGIEFTHLLTITNIPIGRFGRRLIAEGKKEAYHELLQKSFNPATLEGLMCRHQISVGWDGTLYDCDFNLALGLSINPASTANIQNLDLKRLLCRDIVMGEHCYGCTAGSGSSCGGVLS